MADMSSQDRQCRSIHDPFDVALELCRSRANAIKSVIAGFKAMKPAETIAKELGISKAYVYALKRKA